MSVPAARLGAAALAGALLLSGVVACGASPPSTVQAVDSPSTSSTTTPEPTPPASTTTSTPSTTSEIPSTTSPAASPTPPSRSTARATPKPTRTPTPTTAPKPAPPSPPSPTGTDAYENEVLSLVNAERTAAGLKPLVAQACPDGFAEPWSPKMAADGGLSHQSLGPVLTRCSARTAAENVGMNSSPSPASMVAGFMGSPPHRANILNPAYTGIGVSAYRDARGVWWVTQDFVG